MNQTDIQYAEAKDYAMSKPQTTARQLRERYQSLRPEQARKLVYRARDAAKKRGEVLTLVPPQQQQSDLHELAREYAVANPTMTAPQLRQMFGLSDRHARKLMQRAREKSPMPVARAVATLTPRKVIEVSDEMKAARQHLIENPDESVTAAAIRFGVAHTTLCRWWRDHRRTDAVVKPEPKPPRKQRRRLFAIMADGERCEARLVRNTKSIERFEMVMA